MRIRNDFVAMKNGKQEIKIHNTILDTYIKNIIQNQFEVEAEKRIDLSMRCVFIKFDTELNFDRTSILSREDFDLSLEITNYKTETSKKEIINNYTYSFIEGEIAVDIKENIAIHNFKKYNGKKITAIGFSNYRRGEIYACLDTRNYNIYYDATQILSINRRDILSTDAYFYSNDENIQEPIHLYRYKKILDKNYNSRYYYAVLKSVGLGHTPYKMIEEHTLLPYEEHIQVNENSITITDELTIEKKSEGLFPEAYLYPATDLYPERIIINNLYPATDIYPNIDVYPVQSAYQYVQLKYEIYYEYYKDNAERSYLDTGNYYLLSMPIGNKEKIKLNILYERA